ncbi:MAG TPA: hypothetical protein VGI11_17940 [Variovorax sp.]|jgi:hypothetical protein
MTPSLYIANFFAGAFLCNCVPHLVAGLQGAAFPTPFATPRGVGESSALVNFLWGLLNLVAGLFLLWLHPLALNPGPSALLFLLGALLLGCYLAIHFGKVRAERPTR